VVFPPAQHGELRGLLENIRAGVAGVSKASLVRTEGMGLLVVLVQVVNLVGALRELRRQTANKRVWQPFANAIVATGAAGFTAAQSLGDTALKNRSSFLATNLQQAALKNVHVQLGKLHVGLGFFTYLAGLASSANSLVTQRKNWEQAIRSGSHSAGNAAALGTLGSSGMTTVNAYGLGHTLYAGYTVIVAPNGAARTAAWAAAGTRLSTVFFRFNLAGALFTVLELSGSWLYSRFNLSAHDKWLTITPWSRDGEMRGDHTLDDYQSYLAFLIHAPYAQLGRNPHDYWLKDLLVIAKTSDIHLVLPRLTLNDLLPPLGSEPSCRLGIGAHRISTPLHSRGVPRERRDVISNEIVNSLRIVKSNSEGLVLCLQYPTNSDSEFVPAKETLELAVCIQAMNKRGEWQSRTRVIHLDPRGDGHYAVVAPQFVKEKPPLVKVEIQYLERADHAQ